MARVHHRQLIGTGVGVARAQAAGQGLAVVVGEAEHGVKAIATLEVAGRRFLVSPSPPRKRQTRGSPARALRRRSTLPGPEAGRSQTVEHGGVDLAHGPPGGRRGGHFAEQFGLVAERGHVGITGS